MIAAILTLAGTFPVVSHGQDQRDLDIEQIEAEVERIFERSCARSGCHAGPVPQQGLELTAERFVESTVGVPSRERPELMRVHPGEPDSSYLVMKIRGDPGIEGVPMPMVGDRLSDDEVATIETWASRLTEQDIGRSTLLSARETFPFTGWKVMNLPTARTLDAGSWLFLISHRFNPPIGEGYEAFYGLDGSGIIYLSMGYAVADALLVALGRSNADDNVELQVRQRLVRQSQRWPASAALQVGINWITEPVGGQSRFRSALIKPYAQLSMVRSFGDGGGIALVPGLLFNPDHREDGEAPLTTLGIGGRWRIWRNVALVGEWVPIITGYTRTTTFGNINRFDSWGGGIDITTGGHVFQIVVSNSVGLTTDQYMLGGDLDIADGDLRLGFNIFRILNF